jgi:molybdopterin/thiamine biosynthesis adenylyltransferase
MNSADRGKQLYAVLRANGFSADRSETQFHRFVGNLRAAGREVGVSISFRDTEFTELPSVHLLDPDHDAPDVAAHLFVRGGLCFGRNEDIVLDRYNVAATVQQCLEMARHGLERVLTHTRLGDEIAREFPQHWRGFSFYYDLQRKSFFQATWYAVDRDVTKTYLLTDKRSVVWRLARTPQEYKKIILSGHSAIVFTTDKPLTFDRFIRSPVNLHEFEAWLETLLPGETSHLIEAISSAYPARLPLIFVNGPNGCVGAEVMLTPFQHKAAQRKQALAKQFGRTAKRFRIDRYSGYRIDLNYIFCRNMNRQSPLSNVRIALIGCGTIGSHLAKMLVQSGAGHRDNVDGEEGLLCLVDNQRFEPGNVSRHYLGIPHVGAFKSVALKDELKRSFPDSEIRDITKDAVSYFENLAEYDLIIDATGEESLSNSLNQYFVERRAKGHAPTVVHVWLLGNGVAAQSLLVRSFDSACYKCLKPDHAGVPRFSPLKSGVTAIQTVAACGDTQFTPYAVVAPISAAALAMQMVLDWKNGVFAERLRTVRIDKAATNHVKDQSPSRSARCPACASIS